MSISHPHDDSKVVKLDQSPPNYPNSDPTALGATTSQRRQLVINQGHGAIQSTPSAPSSRRITRANARIRQNIPLKRTRTAHARRAAHREIHVTGLRAVDAHDLRVGRRSEGGPDLKDPLPVGVGGAVEGQGAGEGDSGGREGVYAWGEREAAEVGGGESGGRWVCERVVVCCEAFGRQRSCISGSSSSGDEVGLGTEDGGCRMEDGG